MINHANDALMFLIDTVLSLYILVVLLRMLLQAVHADFRNPISQMVWQATRIPIGLLGRVIPRWNNIDVPAIVFAVILCYINIEVDLALAAPSFGPQLIAAIGWAVLKAVVLLCNFYFFTILIQALMSWFSPGHYSPATTLLVSVNEPLLRPVRNTLPPIGGLDLSPLVVIIGLQVVSRLLPLPGLFR